MMVANNLMRIKGIEQQLGMYGFLAGYMDLGICVVNLKQMQKRFILPF